MATLDEVRAQFPQYGDMSDKALADALHAKFYSDMPAADFYGKIGLKDATKADMKADPRAAFRGPLSGLTDLLTQGMTFNLGDEIGAGGLAAFDAARNLASGKDADFGKSYSDRLAQKRSDVASARKEYPALGTAAEIVGGVANPAVNMALSGMAPAASMVGRVGQAIPVGGALGLAYGAGGSEANTPGGILSDAVSNAAIGSALGGLAVPVIEGGSGALNAMARRVMQNARGLSPADRKIGQLIAEKGNGDLETGLLAVQDEIQKAGRDAALVDVLGSRGVRLARGAAQVPSGAQATDDFVNARMAGRGERLQSAADVFGPRRNMVDLAEKMNDAQSMASGPLYDSAFRANQSVSSPEIDRILNTPAGQSALKSAATMMQNDRTLLGKIDPELTAALREAADLGKADYVPGGVANGLKMRTLDYVKRALGDVEGGAISRGERDSGRIIGNLRRGLTDELDRLDVTAKAGPKSLKMEGGDYARARAEYSAIAREKDALDLGSSFLKGDADVTSAAIRGMGDAERQAFRMGARKALSDLIRADRQSAVNRLADKKEATWDRIRAAFPAEEVDKFHSAIRTEAEKMARERIIWPNANSQTVSAGMDVDELTRMPSATVEALSNIAQGNKAGAVRSMLSGARDWATRPSDKMAAGVSRILLERDPVVRAEMLRRIGAVPTAPMISPGAQQGLLAGATVSGAEGPWWRHGQ